MDARVAACLPFAERCAAGALSPQIALMEMLLATEDDQLVELALGQLGRSSEAGRYAELQRVFEDNRAGCAKIARILRAEQSAGEPRSIGDSLAFSRQLFDSLVQESEETSVALYSLGNPEILARATAEIVAVLQRYQLLTPDARVLDVGCGIGRMALALAPLVREVDGIDLSPQMVAVAGRRCAELTNVRIRGCTGQDFGDFASRSKELVLAVDSFPYVVQGGDLLVDAIFSEAARVLVPAGRFVLLNFSYRADLQRDQEQARALASRHGFVPEVLGEQPFSLWNGALYSLRRA